MPAHTAEPARWGQPAAPEPDADRGPIDTSAFFASRAQVASNGAPTPPAVEEPQPQPPAQARPPAAAEPPQSEAARHAVHELTANAGADDAIYQKMLSEWLVDPTDLAKSEDLNWESVWDHGWSAAAAAEDAPVQSTPRRVCRCASPAPGWCPVRWIRGRGAFGRDRNGDAHRGDDGDDRVASAAEFGTAGPRCERSAGGAPAAAPIPRARPRCRPREHQQPFRRVHAGPAHAQETRGTDSE